MIRIELLIIGIVLSAVAFLLTQIGIQSESALPWIAASGIVFIIVALALGQIIFGIFGVLAAIVILGILSYFI